MKSSPSGRGRARIGAIVVAALMVVTGLLLAVGAGARSGKSVRDASYPVSYAFKMNVSGPHAKAQGSPVFKTHARFRFHAVYATTGQKPPPAVLKSLFYKCKLDKKHKQKCDSPQSYGGLSKGKHKFGVQAFYKTTGDAASAVKKVKFKVG